MTIIFPEATPVQGTTKVQFVLAVANQAAPATATEVKAASSLDVSYFIRDWNPDLAANTGQSPARLATSVSLPVEGNTNFSPVELRYVYDPQAADSHNNNKLKALLTRGLLFYAVVRKGPDAVTVDWTAGQRVETWKCRAGKQRPGRTGDDEFSEYEMAQMVFPLAEPVYGTLAA